MKPVARFTRTLSLQELQEITDREVGSEPDLGGDINQEQLVTVERKIEEKETEPTIEQPLTQLSDTDLDPLAGVAA